MCARFSLKSSADVLQDLFDLDDVPEISPRYNIAPTQPILGVVQENGRRECKWLLWGLIPSWAKDPSIGTKMINARAETLLEKPSYRAAFKRRRCLIPVDGFFEWTEVVPKPVLAENSLFDGPLSDRFEKPAKPYKQPLFIRQKNEQPFAIAGLWEYWETPTAGPVESCTLITTEPNELLKSVHTRMPAILEKDEYEPWLMTDELESPKLMALLNPFPAEKMEMFPVTRAMSNPRFDSPEALAAIA